MSDTQESVMEFSGGPKDGEEESTRSPFPAPDEYRTGSEDTGGSGHRYERVDIKVNRDEVRHFYEYRGRE